MVKADMEEMLEACLRTTAFLGLSRDHHKVHLDMVVAPDVSKLVLTHPVWLCQMTRACLQHSLHPDDEGLIELQVSYQSQGWLRVGVEADWKRRGEGG
ncbi:unnamed protein product, partial [Choristocarpus tenellus]